MPAQPATRDIRREKQGTGKGRDAEEAPTRPASGRRMNRNRTNLGEKRRTKWEKCKIVLDFNVIRLYHRSIALGLRYGHSLQHPQGHSGSGRPAQPARRPDVPAPAA